MVITLRFTEPSSLHFFHPPALTAFLRTLLGSPVDYDIHLILDAPESGRTVYRAGDNYRFTLFCLPSGEALMQTVKAFLMRLPCLSPRGGAKAGAPAFLSSRPPYTLPARQGDQSARPDPKVIGRKLSVHCEHWKSFELRLGDQ